MYFTFSLTVYCYKMCIVRVYIMSSLAANKEYHKISHFSQSKKIVLNCLTLRNLQITDMLTCKITC